MYHTVSRLTTFFKYSHSGRVLAVGTSASKVDMSRRTSRLPRTLSGSISRVVKRLVACRTFSMYTRAAGPRSGVVRAAVPLVLFDIREG